MIAFALFRKERALIILAGAFNLLLLTSIIFMFIAVFVYFFKQVRFQYESRPYNPEETNRALSKDFLGISLMVFTLLLIIAVYLYVFQKIAIGKAFQSNMISEILIPMNYIIHNKISGLLLLTAMIFRVFAYLSAILLTCKISFLDLFLRYRSLASVFLFFIFTALYGELIKWLTWALLNLLGGVAFMTELGSNSLIGLTLGFEIVLLLLIIATNGSLVKMLTKRESIKIQIVTVKEAMNKL
jgi:hypothetical protein